MNIAVRFPFRGVTTAAVSLATLSALALGSAPGVAAAGAARDSAVQAHPARPADRDRHGGSTRPGSRPSTGAEHGPRGYALKFTKNRNHPDRSTLSLVHDGIPVKTYRAGSGLGSTDECASMKGWLPNGTYQVKGHQTHRDSDIKGYAIQLSDKACRPERGDRAVTRDSLFIHSEMTRNGGQGSTEPTRWNGDGDYKSYGCIKLHPDHIKDLFSRLEQAHWPKNLTLQVS
ncbi:L,D-transpeptidase family protein [Streptomyces sp. NPDC004244]|uniref:L,D-transpeptidase family protein n=1 Tax=Streptomyces sp. NPDC101206 TaxID=3366128 RepID=UPI0037F83FB5